MSQRSPFGLLIKLLLTPVEGWKAIKRSDYTPEQIARGCFYPLLALVAASQFIGLLYNTDASVSRLLERAIVAFVSGFASYFCILALSPIGTKGEVREAVQTRFYKNMIMMALSTLALFYTLFTLLPMIAEVLVFLPIYTLYLVARGVRFMRVPAEKEMLTICRAELLVIGVPVLLNYFLVLIMPAV